METYSGTRPKVKMEVDECGTVFLCQEIMTNRQGTIRASRSTVCEKPKSLFVQPGGGGLKVVPNQ